MTNIVPISDLKNYSEVLGHCDDGATVYLTKNGRGRYVVQSLIEYEKLQATVKLLAELSKGVESIRNEGGLSVDRGVCRSGGLSMTKIVVSKEARKDIVSIRQYIP